MCEQENCTMTLPHDHVTGVMKIGSTKASIEDIDIQQLIGYSENEAKQCGAECFLFLWKHLKSQKTN